jgi:hypothetical protein
MGMRRRRKKLTTVLTSLDRGVRSATLKQVRRQVPPSSSDVVEEAETTTTTAPPVGTQIAVDPPDQWAKVIGGYYYPPTRTGGLGQVELFIEENLSLSISDKMYVSGTEVKYNQTSGGKTYTGSFRPNTGSYESTTTIRVVSQYGNPSWSTRAASTKPTYAAIPSGVTNSILYTVTNKDYIPNRVTLSFQGQVASYFATTTTATITFTAAHHFVVGHILDVSSLGSPMKDIDGIIKVTAVPSNTQISYEFTNPLGSSISTTTPSTTSYVNAVVSKYTAIGASWIDSSVVPNKVYIWNGLRWAGYTDALEDGLVTNDGIAPAPPTSLSLSSTGYNEDGVLEKISKSYVDLSWSAPTTNASGGSLNDLAGYRVWYSTTSATGPWEGKQNFGQETEQRILGLVPQKTYYFRVIAFDSYGLDSTGLNGSILTEKAALTVNTPSTPTLVARLGTVKVSWDGKDNANAATPLSVLARVEVHASTSTGFTPSASTLLGFIVNGAGSFIAADLDYNIDYYFKLVAIDINDRATSSSLQATIKVLPLVDADLIAAKLNAPLSSWPFADGAVTPGALAAGAIDADTLFGPGVIKQVAIAADAIGTTQLAANAITAGKILAGEITGAKIAALTIEADNIKANAITAAKIAAGTITTDKLVAGDLIGYNIQTASSGTRVILNGSNISFYNSVNSYSGAIFGLTTYASQTGLRINGPGNPSIEVDSTGIELIAVRDGSGNPTDWFDMRYGSTLITDGSVFIAGNGSVELYNESTTNNILLTGYGVYINGRLEVGGRVFLSGLNAATTNLANTRKNTGGGNELTVTNQSSIRFKKDVVNIETVADLDPQKLLSLPVRAFRYKDDYPIAETDGRYGKLMPGFIAEEVFDIYPLAADIEDGESDVVESWNERMMLPPMLALIQDLYRQLEEMRNSIG